MMLSRVSLAIGLACCGAWVFSPAAFSAQAQPAAGGAEARASLPVTQDARKFDPKDLSGIWRGSLYAYGRKVPAFTAEGQRRFDANKPSYGLRADSPEARTRTDLHVGRRRAVVPALNNDAVQQCNPLGLMRLILYAPAGSSLMEIIQLPHRLLQKFEWTWDHREVWADGRPLPNVEDYLPRWNGYSVGRWEGDAFVVETVGLDDRQWVDHYGYPVSSQARLIERWRRVNYSNLELVMTLIDPLLYTTPWESDVARFRLVESGVSTGGWEALLEDRCVPLDEGAFFEEVVKPVSGVQ